MYQVLLWMLGIALRDKGNPVKTVMWGAHRSRILVCGLGRAALKHQHLSPTPLPSEAGLDTDRGPHPQFLLLEVQAGA